MQLDGKRVVIIGGRSGIDLGTAVSLMRIEFVCRRSCRPA
jgi:hypothetical protein